MPKSVDKYLSALQSKGMPKSEAIAIGKKQGKITQDGKHLAAGPKMNTSSSPKSSGSKSPAKSSKK